MVSNPINYGCEWFMVNVVKQCHKRTIPKSSALRWILAPAYMLHPEIPSSCGWSNSSLPLQRNGDTVNTPWTNIGNDEKGMKRSECPGKRMKRFNLLKKMRRNWGKIVVPEWVYIAIYIYIMTLGFSLNGRYPNSHQSWWAKNKRVLLHWNWGCPFSDELRRISLQHPVELSLVGKHR